MSSAPSGERTAPGGARATRPGRNPEAPIGIKLAAGLVLLGGIGDAFVGLLTVETVAPFGVVLLGVAVAELYLAYGLYYLQEWAYRGTVVLQLGLLAILAFLGQAGPVIFKLVLVAYLLSKRDVGWR